MPIFRKASTKIGKIFENTKISPLKDVKMGETHFLFINDSSQTQPNRNFIKPLC